jgi:hypothetical protein
VLDAPLASDVSSGRRARGHRRRTGCRAEPLRGDRKVASARARVVRFGHAGAARAQGSVPHCVHPTWARTCRISYRSSSSSGLFGSRGSITTGAPPKIPWANPKFLTKRLWGAASEPPSFHHGLYTSLREAVVAHSGEAIAQRRAFEALNGEHQRAVLAFLESLQVLPPTSSPTVANGTACAELTGGGGPSVASLVG